MVVRLIVFHWPGLSALWTVLTTQFTKAQAGRAARLYRTADQPYTKPYVVTDGKEWTNGTALYTQLLARALRRGSAIIVIVDLYVGDDVDIPADRS